jgi:hypothetical protein
MIFEVEFGVYFLIYQIAWLFLLRLWWRGALKLQDPYRPPELHSSTYLCWLDALASRNVCGQPLVRVKG